MTDSLGFRLKLGIIAPSTNTAVQPEMDDMRPYGVTNHHGRLHIPDDPIENDDDFNRVMDNIRATMFDAASVVMTCKPQRLVLGMSSETFWDGLEGSKKLLARPPGDDQVRRFFSECGFEIVTLKGLKGRSPVLYSHVSEKQLRDTIMEVNDPSVEAIVQVGTNLAMARLAGIAEFWLDKPVLAINTAIYWHALRNSGIDDRVPGFGSLLLDY
jgi:maleate isomerase